MSFFMQLWQSDIKPRELVRFCFIVIGIAFEYCIVRVQAGLHGLPFIAAKPRNILQEAPHARD